MNPPVRRVGGFRAVPAYSWMSGETSPIPESGSKETANQTLFGRARHHEAHPVPGGVDDDRMFDKVMKPVIQQLAASLKAAGL